MKLDLIPYLQQIFTKFSKKDKAPEELKERVTDEVTDEEIAKNLSSLDWDEKKAYVHQIGSQRIAEYIKYQLSNEKLPGYTTCSNGGPCTA